MNTIRQWFDKWEDVLQREAKVAGLFEQGSMTGAAREFLVERVLRSFIPPIVHVGTGRVIDSDNKFSKQIDLVLYDSRFPILETQPGLGLYLADGVLATIEVKSTLDKSKLVNSLENCRSVLELKYWKGEVCGVSAAAQVSSDSREKHERNRQLRPKTYIFAFLNKMKFETMAKALHAWFHDKGKTIDPMEPALPAIIAVPGTLGILNSKNIQIEDTSANKNQGRPVFIVAKTKRRFGWLALDLIQHINDRVNPPIGPGILYRSVEPYIKSVFDVYANELKQSDVDCGILRDPRGSIAS